jgi:hypothetical protein
MPRLRRIGTSIDPEDYEVIGDDGLAIGRIYRKRTSAGSLRWRWSAYDVWSGWGTLTLDGAKKPFREVVGEE